MAGNLAQEIGKKQPFTQLEQEAFLNVARTAAFLQNQWERFFRSYGLSMSTYNILRILRGSKEARTCTQLRTDMVAPVPDVTRLVDRLIAAGLAQRQRGVADGRTVLINITPEGVDLLAKIDKPLEDLHTQQLGFMSRDELATLNDLLTKARTGAVAHAGGEQDDALPGAE